MPKVKRGDVLAKSGKTIRNSAQYDFNATYNWWGTTDVQVINQTIHDYKNDFNLGNVTFEPFLTEANPSAAPDSGISNMDNSANIHDCHTTNRRGPLQETQTLNNPVHLRFLSNIFFYPLQTCSESISVDSENYRGGVLLARKHAKPCWFL
jgi:hypothetical protein